MDINAIVVGPVATNCYIVSNGSSEAIVIDPGYAADELYEFAREKGLTIVGILLTHGHFDHIMAVNELRELTGAKVYIGEADADLLESPKLNSGSVWGFDYSTKADILLKDGERTTIADMTFKTIFTPGHTKGSVCFYFEKNLVLFTGDTLFAGGIGRTDLATGDAGAMSVSLKKLLASVREDSAVFPGHGDDTSIRNELHNNAYLFS